MDRPQFNPADEPVFNLFDLPAFCEGESPATKPCCGPCTDWLFCIKRSPIELKLPGFDFSAWLPGVSMCATKILPSSGVAEAEFTNTDGSNEFDGTYLTLPDSRYITQGDCGTRTNRCENDSWGFLGGTWWGSGLWSWGGWWWGWWWSWLSGDDYPYEYYPWYDYFYDDFYGRNYEATHHMMQPRTVYAPAADYGQVKDFYIDAQVRCVLNDEDQPCLEFLGLLRFSWEKAEAGCLGCTFDEYGINACDPSILGAIEAAEGWDHYNGEYKYCVPLMRSDLIPLDGLTIAALTDIPLNMIPPPEWELVSPGSGFPDYWRMIGGSFGGCVLPELGLYKSVGWMTGYNTGLGCTPEGAENLDCGGTEEGAPARDAHPTGHECPTDVWLPTGCSYFSGVYYGYGAVCVPAPITANNIGPTDGPKLSVLSDCFPVDGCSSCLPDPENPQISKKVEFSVTVTGSGCYKTFTPVITDCVNVVKVYYSWGDVGVGLDPVTHTIVNTDDGGVSRSETFLAIAVDDRGCYYCFKDTVICGCCPETSGTLEATSLLLNVFRLCATTNGTPETGPCAGLETTISWTGEHVIPNAGTLGNGDCVNVTVTGGAGTPRITYRVIDGAGCIGDPVELELWRISCACCVRPLNGVKVTIDGWGTINGLVCQNCDDFNQTYELHPDAGVEFTCLWRYQTALGDGPDLVCRPTVGESLGYFVGREIFFSIQCVGDGTLLLCVYANMSEATINYYKIISCSSGPPFFTPTICDGGHPVDCATLIGDVVTLTRDSLGVHCGDEPNIGACNPMPSTCIVELTWGS